MHKLFILEINPLSVASFANILSHTVSWPTQRGRLGCFDKGNSRGDHLGSLTSVSDLYVPSKISIF